MKHLAEDELILHYYSEPGNDDAEQHLGSCASCREALDRLRADLAPIDGLAVPERDPGYPERVRRQVEARRTEREHTRSRGWFTLPRLSLAGALAAALLVAFLAGDWFGRSRTILPALDDAERQRVMLVAVGNHLDDTRRVLLDLVRADAASGASLDVDGQRRRAARLASDSRLYGASARLNGDERMADLLDDLERLLLEVSNGSEQFSVQERNDLGRRVERQGILLRVQVLGEDARRRGKAPVLPPQA